MCFPFSVQEIGRAKLRPELPINSAGLFALFIFWDDGFAQSPVAVTAGFPSQARPKEALHCRDPRDGLLASGKDKPRERKLLMKAMHFKLGHSCRAQHGVRLRYIQHKYI